jgi:uncharacterized protein (TIGR03086 family)
VVLLERAIEYLEGSLVGVTPGDLARPTPCGEWDLATLLAHLDDSLAALCEAGDLGRVGLRRPQPFLVAADGVVDRLIGSAWEALAAWSDPGPGHDPALIGGCPLAAGLIAAVGALEVAVHGWDIGRTLGRQLPLPDRLAEDLLARLPRLVSALDRPDRFADPLPVSPWMPAGERLLALLGRRPVGSSAPAA